MNLSQEEFQADLEAENAMKAAHNFRELHIGYFMFEGRFNLETGRPLVEPQPHLNREFSRLHEIACKANRKALEIEYNSKFNAVNIV